MKDFGLEKIIFVCTDSMEMFFSKLRSAGLNYNMPSFSLTLTVWGVSNKHCLLTFFIGFVRSRGWSYFQNLLYQNERQDQSRKTQ